jgi:hypothetical protein
MQDDSRTQRDRRAVRRSWTQKLFGWWSGPGLEGTTKVMDSLGMKPGRRHALAGGLSEAVGGALLVTDRAIGLRTTGSRWALASLAAAAAGSAAAIESGARRARTRTRSRARGASRASPQQAEQTVNA